MHRKAACLVFLLMGLLLLPAAVNAEIIDSGFCGADGNQVMWSLDAEGTLTISGNGRMADYGNAYGYLHAETAPWYSLRGSIKKVTIGDGITNVGTYAFLECTNLSRIELPDTLLTIDQYAFMYCSGLAEAFLPSLTQDIEDNAFYGCGGLEAIRIPHNVRFIGADVWNGCSKLRRIDVDDENPVYFSIAGVLYCDTRLIRCPEGYEGSAAIPDGIQSVAPNAFFHCKNVTQIYFPQGVLEVGASAFENCGLRELSLPDTVKSIGDQAFYGCEGLISAVLSENLIAIGSSAFAGTGLLSVSLPEGIESIGDDAFDAPQLQKVYLPAQAVSIGDDAFPCEAVIYCYQGTDADLWAAESGNQAVYLDDLDPDAICGVTLRMGGERLACGDTTPIWAAVFPANRDAEIIFASSDPSVAAVENGVVTAYKPGSVTITATAGELSASKTLYTYIRADDFEMPDETWMLANKQAVLPIKSLPEGSELKLTWYSSDSSIAEVSAVEAPESGEAGMEAPSLSGSAAAGVVSGKKPGDAIVTAVMENGWMRYCTVHVCYPVTAVSFADRNLSAYVGVPLQLTANVTMHTQTCVNHLIAFASTDESVATVDENGLVTPLKAGRVYITATPETGNAAICTVTVKEMVYAALPAGLREIEAEAFAGALFEAVIIPDGCASIGSRAFADCPNLRYIRIPASVTFVADDSFEGCGPVAVDRIQE